MPPESSANASTTQGGSASESVLGRRAFNRALLERQMLLRGKVTLVIQQFERLSNEDRDALADEGERLLRLVAKPQDAEEFEIRFSREA